MRILQCCALFTEVLRPGLADGSPPDGGVLQFLPHFPLWHQHHACVRTSTFASNKELREADQEAK